MRRRTALVGVLAVGVALGISAPGVAAPVAPRDDATTDLQRGAFISLPAVYEVRGQIRIDAIVLGRRRISVARSVPIRGTAFGVAQDRVVTALHLIAPPARVILDELRAQGARDLPSDPTGVRIVRRPVTTVTLRRARSASECLEGVPTVIDAEVGETTDANGDLALLRIDDPGAPMLALDDGHTAQTPVAVIGFGGQQDPTPVIREGTVSATAAIGQDDRFATLSIEVVRGDSGGPVVDGDGRAHGVVLRRESGRTAPVMAQAKSVRALLAQEDLVNGQPDATNAFRDAMRVFWVRDYREAERRLSALTGAYTDPALVRCQRDRAAALATTGYAVSGPSRVRGAILALGATAALAAAILGILRLRRRR